MSAAVNKKQTESKYVSCFADARPDVDITFRDVLLSRPTDHYLVGVDNFSMTNTSLSMIEPRTGDGETLIRLVINSAGAAPWAQYDQEAGGFANALVAAGTLLVPNHYIQEGTPHAHGYNLSIKSSETILSVQQLMHRLGQLASDASEYMNKGHANGAAFEFGGYAPQSNEGVNIETTKHLKFELATDGRLQIIGTKAFWSCFSIEVPSVQYQFGFFGARSTLDKVENMNRLRRFLSVHPLGSDAPAGAEKVTFRKMLVGTQKTPMPAQAVGQTNADYANAQANVDALNAMIIGGTNTLVLTRATDLGTVNQNTLNTYSATAIDTIMYQTRASLFSTMERRIALEVGCSLPIKNSPMVDHQRESPDFVLGRWIWRSDPRIESNDEGGSRRYTSMMPAHGVPGGPGPDHVPRAAAPSKNPNAENPALRQSPNV